MHDLRIGKHVLDIRFWREGEQTTFEVIKGDHNLVERRDLATEGLGLKTTSQLIQMAQVSAGRSKQQADMPRIS